MSVFPTSVLLFAHIRCPRIQTVSISLRCPNQQSCMIRFPALTQWLRRCYIAHYRCRYSLRTWLIAVSRQWLPVSEILALELMTFQNTLGTLHQYSNFNIPQILCPRLIKTLWCYWWSLLHSWWSFSWSFTHVLIHQIFI